MVITFYCHAKTSMYFIVYYWIFLMSVIRTKKKWCEYNALLFDFFFTVKLFANIIFFKVILNL